MFENHHCSIMKISIFEYHNSEQGIEIKVLKMIECFPVPAVACYVASVMSDSLRSNGL